MKIVTIDLLEPREFEKLVKEILSAKYPNANIYLTPYVRDRGFDIVVHSYREKILVECKHYKTAVVGRPVVQRLHSAMVIEGASRGIIVTTGTFSKEALDYCHIVYRRFGIFIECWDFKRLCKEALAAGILLVRKGEKIFSFDIGKETLTHRLWQYVIQHIESRPIRPEQVIRVIPEIKTYPYFLVEYSVHKIFTTSTGRPIYKINENSKLLVDYTSDYPRIYDATHYISHAAIKPIKNTDIADYLPVAMKLYANLAVDEKNAADYIKKTIARQLSRYVRYIGRNNRIYTKYCKVTEKDVEIHSALKLAVPVIEVQLEIPLANHRYKFWAYSFSDGKIVVLSATTPTRTLDNLFLCNTCGKLLSKDQMTICSSCGATICKPDIFKVPGILRSTPYCDICFQKLLESDKLLKHIPPEKRTPPTLKRALILALILPGLESLYLRKIKIALIELGTLAILATISLAAGTLFPILPLYIIAAIKTLKELRIAKYIQNNIHRLTELTKISLMRKIKYLDM